MSANASNTSEIIDDYDYKGAAIYIAAILIWYSTGLVFMLFFHVRPRRFQSHHILEYETSNKSTPSTRSPFDKYNNIKADNIKEQILKELKDPDRRQRLWKIYYTSSEQQNEPHAKYYKTITADNVTIGRINRKLADINRMYARDDQFVAPVSSSTTDLTKSFTKRLLPIRRSSCVATTTPPPFLRGQSQPDASTEQTDTVICETKVKTTANTNGSRKRTNKFLTRFTIEKVQEDNRNVSFQEENNSE